MTKPLAVKLAGGKSVYLYYKDLDTLFSVAQLFAEAEGEGDLHIFSDGIQYFEEKFGLEEVYKKIIEEYPKYPFADTDPKINFDFQVTQAKQDDGLGY